LSYRIWQNNNSWGSLENNNNWGIYAQLTKNIKIKKIIKKIAKLKKKMVKRKWLN